MAVLALASSRLGSLRSAIMTAHSLAALANATSVPGQSCPWPARGHQLAATALANAIAIVPDGDGIPSGAEVAVVALTGSLVG
jgi:hypothetical protein